MSMPTPYYQDSVVTIYHADCREMLPRLQKVDLILTDPPYGIELNNNDRDGHRRAESYKVIGDDSETVTLYVLNWASSELLPTIVFASPWNPWPGEWRNLIVWDKGGAVGGGGDVQTCLKRSWELIQTTRTGKMFGKRMESVWKYPITPGDTKLHICSKPVELIIALINQFSTESHTILDPFMGSGTTLRAAKDLGRKAIGIEIEEKYCEIAARRMAQEVLAL